jgi:hypothetical protein
MEPENDINELRQAAPRLANIRKEDPFRVPDGFFERFPHRVQALAVAKRTPRSTVWMKRLAIALPLVATVVVCTHLLRRETSTTPVINITADEAAQLLTYGTDDTQDLLTNTGTSDLPDMGTVTIQLTPDEAAAYVDRENIDVTNLITEP